MKKPAILLSILILTVISLLGIRTVIFNRLSTSGVELGKTQEGIIKYKTENTMLREKILSLSSLTFVSSAAGRIGFVENKSNFALSKTRSIATTR